VNGVSALHTELMRETVFDDLHRLYPERIVNKTNGITFRRWLFQANPGLTEIVRSACGDGVLDDPMKLVSLVEQADDPALQNRHREGQTPQQAGAVAADLGPAGLRIKSACVIRCAYQADARI
jgi:starch phosphorylase